MYRIAEMDLEDALEWKVKYETTRDNAQKMLLQINERIEQLEGKQSLKELLDAMHPNWKF